MDLFRGPYGSGLLIGLLEEGNDVDADKEVANMNDCFEFVFDETDLKNQNQAYNGRMTDHGEEIVNNMKRVEIEMSLCRVDHVDTFEVEGFHPHGVDD